MSQKLSNLIAHQGAMCLLDRIEAWDMSKIQCRASSHLDAGNPLRRDARLSGVCGIEYGLQAAAAHGALLATAARSAQLTGIAAEPAGYLASLRNTEILVDRLDDPALGELRIQATLSLRDVKGCVYQFTLASQAGRILVTGRAVIVLPS